MPAELPPTLAMLVSRHSLGIKHLAAPGPDTAQLATLFEAALRAPDHAELVPFRFRVVRGAAREPLADLFADYAARRGKGGAGAALERERALRAPVTIAILARIDLGHPVVPAHEQWMCVGGAVTNLLNAAHAMGFAGKMLSGGKARAPELVRAFCEPGETLVGWVSIGTATRAPAPSGKLAPEVWRDWTGPA